MSKSIIVLDTNILASSPYLDADDWLTLHTRADEWKLHFVVPEIVVMETVNVVRRRWRPEEQKLTALEGWIRSLDKSDELDSIFSAATDRHNQYPETLSARIEELGMEVASLPADIDHMDIARRASQGRAPYASIGKPEDGRTKDGYRDTLIWLTVLEVATSHPDCEVWFVSNNYSDFGSKQETKDPRDTQEYPLAWHVELKEELDRKGLTDRVFYARGLSRLEQHLSSKFAPLPDAERDELWEAVDRTELDRQLVLALFKETVDPRAAALPLDTSAAQVVASVRKTEDFRLSEAARRAAGAWTAQFNCEIDATVEITNSSGDVTDQSKPLVVSGRIHVNADGAVTELIIEAIEAPADDPQRRAWERVDTPRTNYLAQLADLTTPQTNYLAQLANLTTPQTNYLAQLANLTTPQTDIAGGIAHPSITASDASGKSADDETWSEYNEDGESGPDE